MQNMDFRGRWVLITGASAGLGREFAPLAGWLMPVEQCARLGLEAFRTRDYLNIPGLSNRLGSILGRLLPRRFVTCLVARSYRRALEQMSHS